MVRLALPEGQLVSGGTSSPWATRLQGKWTEKRGLESSYEGRWWCLSQVPNRPSPVCLAVMFAFFSRLDRAPCRDLGVEEESDLAYA
jgi:hypothetical protein